MQTSKLFLFALILSINSFAQPIYNWQAFSDGQIYDFMYDLNSNGVYNSSYRIFRSGKIQFFQDTTVLKSANSLNTYGVPNNVLWGGSDGTLFRSHIDSLAKGVDYTMLKNKPTIIPTSRSLTINGTTQDLSTNRTWALVTSDIGEGTNQYFTNSRARSAISLTTTGTTGAATYNSSTGVLNIPQYTGGTGSVTSVGLASTDFSVSGSPITTSGTFTANLNTSGISAGTYNSATYNSKGIATAGGSLVISAPSAGNSFTSGTAFQPNSSGSCFLSVQSTLSGIVGVTGTVVVSMSATQGGTYTTVSTTRLLISVSLITSDMDSGAIAVPAGYWVKVTLSGGVTGTYTKWTL